jgi:tetratricopeptide (TPR) repeat protein
MLAIPAPAKAIDPVDQALGIVLGKLADEGWNWLTDKPDVERVLRCLMELETNAVMKRDMREELSKLRKQINDRVTRDEFRKMIDQTRDELRSIKQKLDDHEQRLVKLEVREADQEKGTKNAKNPEFYLKQGDQFAAEKKLDKAITYYSIAIELDAKKAQPYLRRGQAYWQLGVPPDVVLLDTAEAIRLDASNASAFHLRGRAYDARYRYNQAMAKLARAPRPDPKDAPVPRRPGPPRRGPRLRDIDLAIADFKEAIRLDPKFGQAYADRASSYLTRSLATLAVADCEEAIKLGVKDQAVICTQARAYIALGQYDTAERTLTDSRDSESALGLYIRGAARVGQKDYDSAISYRAKAIRLDAKLADSFYNVKYADAHNRRGVQRFKNSDYDGAIADFSEATRLDPQDSDPRGNLFNSYMRRGGNSRSKGDWDQAIADFTEAIYLNPKDDNAYIYRGWAYEFKGDKVRSKADFAEGERLRELESREFKKKFMK